MYLEPTGADLSAAIQPRTYLAKFRHLPRTLLPQKKELGDPAHGRGEVRPPALNLRPRTTPIEGGVRNGSNYGEFDEWHTTNLTQHLITIAVCTRKKIILVATCLIEVLRLERCKLVESHITKPQ